MEFKTLLNLLDIAFTIIENGLFYGGKLLEVKIWRFQVFANKMAMLT